jgi:glycosyltransferase involved in cell wall biosynthesis
VDPDRLHEGAAVLDGSVREPGLAGVSRDVSSTGQLSVAISLLSHAPEMTGAATYARELIRALGARCDEVRLEVLCNEYAFARLEGFVGDGAVLRRARGFRVGKSPASRAVAMLGAAVFPRRLTRQLQNDPAVVHYPLSVGLPRVALPTVVTAHDAQHLDLPELWSATVRAWRWATYDRVARAATMVVTDSEHARRRLIDALGIAPERIIAVHLAVDHERFGPLPDDSDASLPERLQLPERFVYYPAGFFAQKNHLRLLEAFALLGDRSLQLLLTGASNGRLGEILERARALGVGERVRYLGFVPDADLPALYRHARAVVFPSLYEGFGLPPLEAMACGCPVASSRRASLAEVCGDAAAVLEPEDPRQMADTIAAVLDDEQLRTQLRERGLAWASRFTWDAAAEAHLDVYRRAARLGA